MKPTRDKRRGSNNGTEKERTQEGHNSTVQQRKHRTQNIKKNRTTRKTTTHNTTSTKHKNQNQTQSETKKEIATRASITEESEIVDVRLLPYYNKI